MMALQWDDVDLAKRQVCVARSDWGHVTMLNWTMNRAERRGTSLVSAAEDVDVPHSDDDDIVVRR
jgi:hypothetical protein